MILRKVCMCVCERNFASARLNWDKNDEVQCINA